MQTIIAKLNSKISQNPKIAAIESNILEKLRADLPLFRQQHIKPLWYKERIDIVLKGSYETVSPVNLEFVPSLECNLRCPFCTYRTWKAATIADQGKRKMSYENMVILLDKIESAGVKGVTVTGGVNLLQMYVPFRD